MRPEWTLLEHLLGLRPAVEVQLPPFWVDVRVMELDQEGVDVAREPVDLNTDAEFMDTGVLHEERLCAACGKNPAARGNNACKECGPGGDA